MGTLARTRPSLPELPLDSWEETKTTLHLWIQIVGKVRLAATAPRNHWWHVPLYLDARGLTTRRMHAGPEVSFEVRFDFVDHRLVVETNRGETEAFELIDGLSVAEFDERVHGALGRLGLDVAIRETPYRVPLTTPFPDDREHATYDSNAVERFWRILDWTDQVFEEFAGWFCGKTSPVHLFWHSFDLAVTRFSGRRAPAMPNASRVDREAYSHEVISFGFWPGDDKVREASYYSYTAPEPEGLRRQPLRPEQARWSESGLALLPFDSARTAPDPRAALLAFLESAYEAGARTAGWNREELDSAWCPPRSELQAYLEQA